MAMTPSGLKAEIISQMQAQGFNPLDSKTGGQAEKYIEAIATAVVLYIQQNAKADNTPNLYPII